MNIQKSSWDSKKYEGKHDYVYDYGKSVVALLDPQPHERVLDIGCGTGQLTEYINQQAWEVVGIDQSDEMIAKARQNYPSLSFLVADACKMRFDTPFDAIFSNAAFHWISDQESLIENMYQNLKSGGRMVVEFGSKGNVQIIVNAIRNQLSLLGYHNEAERQPYYFPSIGEYSQKLEANGFTVTFANLFDRRTALADPENGVKDWVDMFGDAFFKGIPAEETEKIKQAIQEEVRPRLFKDGKWYADYKRIRIKAVK